jgi:hypothetical protein
VLTLATNNVAQKEEATMEFAEDDAVLGVRNAQSTACGVWCLRF